MIKTNKKVSVVIPCYNTSNKLLKYSKEIVEVLKKNNYKAEIIYVEDSTPDNNKTWNMLCGIVKKIPKSKCFQMSKNMGQQKAILAGIQQSTGSVVVTIDDDCQHDLKYLLPMIKALDKSDLIIAKLVSRKVGLLRSLGTYLVKQVAKSIFKSENDIYFSSYRAIEGDLARKSSQFPASNPVVSFEIMKLTSRVKNIEILQKDSIREKSTYSISSLISYFLTIILTYTNYIQKIFIRLSFIFAFFATLLLFWYLTKYFYGQIGIPGYASLIAIVSTFASLTFFGIGILMTVISKIDEKLHKQDWYNFSKSLENK